MIDIKSEDINIEISDFATRQIKLIKENDYTVSDLVFRLQISGKGCNGFDYSLGFTEKHADDLLYTNNTATIAIDPFSAFYCKNGKVDFVFDHENNLDGFIFTNHNEKNHRGKFFKDEAKLPSII